jgi:hypothetical protein
MDKELDVYSFYPLKINLEKEGMKLYYYAMDSISYETITEIIILSSNYIKAFNILCKRLKELSEENYERDWVFELTHWHYVKSESLDVDKIIYEHNSGG